MENNTTRTERTCITCPGLGRDGADGRPNPNYYDYRWACEECRPQLHGILHRIPLTHTLLDPTPGNAHNEHVSGTIDAPLGVRIAVLDELYTGPATTLPLIPTGPDQDGTLPAARILWHITTAWWPAWHETHPSEHLPEPTITALTAWLEKRTDWACNNLPALLGDSNDQPGHARILSALAHRLDRLIDPGTSKPEPIPFVPCRDCDRYSLARLAGDIICTHDSCGIRMSPDEYERWTKLQAAYA
jgi:hypothetical protein